MWLEEFSAASWRSFSELKLKLDPRLVVFWGENGVGKTNILEGIGALATLSSFRGASFREAVSWGQKAAALSGSVKTENGGAKLGIKIAAKNSGGIRKVYLDDVQVRDLSRYFERLRAVVFIPSDTSIIRGSPELRRRFIDRAAFNTSPLHLDEVRIFKRVLAQKASLLRRESVSTAELDVWNEQLIPAGVALTLGRRKLVHDLQDPAQELHKELSDGGRVALRYKSFLKGSSTEELAQSYGDLLISSRAEELRRGVNLVGPQRDDLEVLFEPSEGGMRSAKSFGSQGQVRTLALSLKLAELKVAGKSGDPPIMLIDDLSSELDEKRTTSLIRLLEALEAQVLVTTTDPELVLRSARRAGQALNVATLK